MQNLSFGFSLDDNMSQGLKSITEALSGIVNYLDDVNKSIDTVDKKNFNALKKNVNQACSNIDQIGQSFNEAGQKASVLNRASLNNINKTATKVSQSIGDIGNEAVGSAAGLNQINGSSINSVTKVAQQATKEIDKLGDESVETGEQVSDIGEKFSAIGKTIGTIAAAAVSIEGIKKALNWADEVTNTTSRLNLVNQSFNEINKSAQTTRELQDKIFYAAQASRGSYQDLQEMVAKLGNSAKSAFSNTDEIIQFGSTMNKIFALSGASSEEMSSSILQLSQALSSGVLQGDEFKSLTETNPVFLDYLAQGMGVARENLKEMGSEGQLTSQAIVTAMTNMSSEISAQFLQLQPTFGNVWTYFTNTAQHAFEPVAQELAKLAIDPQFQDSMDQLGTTIADLAPKVKDFVAGIVANAPDVISKIVDAFSWLTEHGSELGTTIISLGAAFGTLSIISSIAGMMSALGVAITIPLAPIALVVAAIAGIGAGLVWLWNTNEGFRNDVIAVWEAIKQAFNNAWTNISGFFASFDGAWSEAVTSIQNLAGAIGDTFSGWYNSALEWGGNLIQGLKDGAVNKWNEFTSWVSESFNWVINNVKSIFGIASPSTVFADIGTNLLQGLWNGLKGIWTGLSGWIGGVWDSIKNTFSGNQNTNIDFSQTEQQLNNLKATVQDTFNQINAQAQSIAQMSATVISSFINMVNTSIGSVATLETTTVNTVTAMVSNLIALCAELQNNLIAIWSNVENTTIAIVVAMSNSVISTISSMCASILSEINKLPSKFYTAGFNMMSSLIKGIESQRGAVKTLTSDIVNTLKTTFETGLGIHSPSDYMIWVGQMMLAGLLQGMSGSQVQKFIESMISDMQSSFENGKFNANELVNYLSDPATLALIGKVTGLDTKGMSAESIAYPLIGTMGTQTSWFGLRDSPGGIGSTNHQGADLAAPEGTPIAAAIGGTVTTADWYGGYGQAVVINSGNGLDIVYGHMSQILAQQGQTVAKGTQIGLVGSTGNSTGPHLHFEMRNNGTAFDPQPYLEGASISAGNTLANVIQQAYNLKHGIVTGSSSMGNISFDVSAGAAQWAPQVLQALQMLGQPADLLQAVLYAIQSESGGNPNARNDWDSNAAIGQNSAGLLQTIPDTFNAYRNPNLSANIYDPLSNIYAGLNYMIQRYGSVAAVVNPRLGGWYGYEVGTRYVPQDMLAMIHEGEAILPASQNPYTNSGGDYLADMFSNIAPESQAANTGYADSYFDFDSTLDDEPAVVQPTSTGGNVYVTLNVTQNISGNENARAKADEIIDYLYDEIEKQYNSRGGALLEY